MKDYFSFGWRACGAGIVFQVLVLICFFILQFGIAVSPNNIGFNIMIACIIAFIITLLALSCRPLYEKALEKRFPDTGLSKKVFILILFSVAIVLLFLYLLVMGLVAWELNRELLNTDLPAVAAPFLLLAWFIMVALFTFFYFLLYTTASIEYIWRRYIHRLRESAKAELSVEINNSKIDRDNSNSL